MRLEGDFGNDTIGGLREVFASLNAPLTLEHAPQETLRTAGHFDPRDAGVKRITESLRDRYDPARVFDVPLFAMGA